MSTVLFLCTGNYYRSRFAEFYFRHLAAQHGLEWNSDSRGLALDPYNPGPLSRYTHEECSRHGISMEPVRFPQPLAMEDLQRSSLVVAVKETEHRPLMRRLFPEWEEQVIYWEVHDLDCAPPSEAFPELRRHVETLIGDLLGKS